MPLHVRLATPADAPALLEIYAPMIRDTAVSFETKVPTPEVFAARITATLERAPWLLCEIDGAAAGYAYATRYRERAAYQWSVEATAYVAESFRGQGVASLLYRNLFHALRAQEYRTAYAGITLPNPSSVALHEAMGFRKIGVFESAGYKFGKWHGVGWWGLPLIESDEAPRPPKPPSEVLAGIVWEQGGE